MRENWKPKRHSQGGDPIRTMRNRPNSVFAVCIAAILVTPPNNFRWKPVICNTFHSTIIASVAKSKGRLFYLFGQRKDFRFKCFVATPLELERSVFDSEETRVLSAAFERAWAYVEFDPPLGALEEWKRQSELARCLMALLKLGDDDPVILANSGIALLHKIHKKAQNRSRDISRRTYGAQSSAIAPV